MEKRKTRKIFLFFFQNNGEILTETIDIAQGFNIFYTKIGAELSSKIPQNNKNYKDYLGDSIVDNFIFGNISEKLIIEMTGKLKPKTSAGPDGISTKLLKEMIPFILLPITHLFNLSFKTGYIPTELKTAKVIPIFKSACLLYTSPSPRDS